MIHTRAAASARLGSFDRLARPHADCGKVRQCVQPNLACLSSSCSMLRAATRKIAETQPQAERDSDRAGSSRRRGSRRCPWILPPGSRCECSDCRPCLWADSPASQRSRVRSRPARSRVGRRRSPSSSRSSSSDRPGSLQALAQHFVRAKRRKHSKTPRDAAAATIRCASAMRPSASAA